MILIRGDLTPSKVVVADRGVLDTPAADEGLPLLQSLRAGTARHLQNLTLKNVIIDISSQTIQASLSCKNPKTKAEWFVIFPLDNMRHCQLQE